MPDPAIRMLTWGARLLFLGPAFRLSAHRNGVGVLCICLDGEMEVLAGEGLRSGSGTVCRSVYVPPGTRHLIRFEASRIACMYVDRESDDPGAIEREMTPGPEGLLTGHARQKTIIQALRIFDSGRLTNSEARAMLALAYGVAPVSGQAGDPRISSTIRAIRENPSLPHHAADLARRVGLSASRFRHAFREVTGVPLKRYRVWARVGAAMTAVRTGANLTQAAHAAGFSSSAHFSTAYRSMFGLTPSAFVAASRSPGPTQASGFDSR